MALRWSARTMEAWMESVHSNRRSSRRSHVLVAVTLATVALLALSGMRPYDRTTWLLEVFPVIVALPLLWPTYGRFPLTPLLYCCIFMHALVLMLGGAYTYARVPLGFQVAEWLELTRNP